MCLGDVIQVCVAEGLHQGLQFSLLHNHKQYCEIAAVLRVSMLLLRACSEQPAILHLLTEGRMR